MDNIFPEQIIINEYTVGNFILIFMKVMLFLFKLYVFEWKYIIKCLNKHSYLYGIYKKNPNRKNEEQGCSNDKCIQWGTRSTSPSRYSS